MIISIISAVTLSRILRSDTFDAYIIRDQIISLSRTAQQSALGRADVILTIIPSLSLDAVTLTTSYGVGPTTISSVKFDLAPIVLAGSVNNTASCSVASGTAVTNAAPLIVRFDELGSLTLSGFGAGVAVTESVKICLNENPANSICISPAGFAYKGDCDV